MAVSTITNNLEKRLSDISSSNNYVITYKNGVTSPRTDLWFNTIVRKGNVCRVAMRFTVGSTKVTGWTTFATVPNAVKPVFPKQKCALLPRNSTDGSYLRAYLQITSDGNIVASGDLTAGKQFDVELIYII